jgi:hypothetical protein
MVNTKEDLIRYYDGTRLFWGAYHHHKEISAWAGLGLHVLFCGLILQARFPDDLMMLWSVVIAILVLSSCILVYLYIRNQLQMKDNAGSWAGGAFFLLAEILQKDESELELTLADYLLIEKRNGKGQGSLFLPKILLEKGREIHECEKNRFYQDRTKSMIYGLLVLSTLSVLIFNLLHFFESICA